MPRKRYAAIDVGTVTCRLLIADIGDDGLHEIERKVAIVNLGEGVDASGMLKREAMDRVESCVAAYRKVILEHQKDAEEEIRVIAIATSAARDARNSDEFVGMLARHGIALTVVPGEREAALSFLGASIGYEGERLLVADIGGGSTELVVGTAGEEPRFKHSFDIGCRRVTEKFLHNDPPELGELAEALMWMNPSFASFFDEVSRSGLSIDRVIAVAGTATSVVSIDRAMKVYDSAVVDGTTVSFETLDRIYRKLAGMTLSQRRKVVGLDPGRAPVIVAGMVILESVLLLAGKDVWTVSESDILQGIILDAHRRFFCA